MKSKIISISMKTEQADKIDKLAEEFHMTRSEFVRFVLRRGTGFAISVLRDFPDLAEE